MPRWTEESRSRQSDRIKEQRPWLAATGPVTAYGRSVSSQNAKKHRRWKHEKQESGIGRPFEIGDRVIYDGGYQETMLACGHQPMVVTGFCQMGTNAIACRTAGGKLIWIYPQDLQRCLDE